MCWRVFVFVNERSVYFKEIAPRDDNHYETMDEEETAGYRVPCFQCSSVNWGLSSGGQFYCRTCHNVIERTVEVQDTYTNFANTRISSISKAVRQKKPECSRQWVVCEGFQFILKEQAASLVQLGVPPQFQDEVLWPMWRLYLQRTRQAYTSNPVTAAPLPLRDQGSESESAIESMYTSTSNTDGEGILSSASSTMDVSSSNSGRRPRRLRRNKNPTSMRTTLALLHLALVWCRQALTLSDLLRLAAEGHIPYINAHEHLPEEMKLYGKDAIIFRVQTVPSHRLVHKEATALARALELPAFPPISRQCLLHPELLTQRYLADANLPDELHLWVCILIERANMMSQKLNTLNPKSCPNLPLYDNQAAALIIITMKLLFGFDDKTEWVLSNNTHEHGDSGNQFNLRRWYRLLHLTLLRAKRDKDQETARRCWTSRRTLSLNSKKHCVQMKSKRIAHQLQMGLEKLTHCPSTVERRRPSSFVFCWGDGKEDDGPSMMHQRLDTTLRGVFSLTNPSYWHRLLKSCDSRKCSSHYKEQEPSLPRSFVWLLHFFSFLLRVKTSRLYDEVLRMERRLFGRTSSRSSTGTRTARKSASSIGTQPPSPQDQDLDWCLLSGPSEPGPLV